MSTLLEQIKQRRLALDLKQSDISTRIGMTRQQYQRLESQGNPRLETLDLVAHGLNSRLMLIPKDKLHQVELLLSGKARVESTEAPLDHDPWRGLLVDLD